ncbi:carbon monoxide dehydrogenase subunit G [Catenulispora subtropica]|uniref:Carbon monoxide dehydrogenase subunit G n=1 Tax=Catenulispora subtropica TaxID=450798 RepID=A0ABP5D3C3_9ACTN
MKVSGNAVLRAEVGRVFEALTDPATLAAAIPGCERLELVAPDVYDMVVTVGVGSIKGTYKGRVELADRVAPRSFTLRASGAGAPGTVSAECRMLLVDEVDGRTRVEYDADAVVGGVVGGVGQRMLGGVARKLAGQFFTGMDGVLAREGAPAPVAMVAAGSAEAVTATAEGTRYAVAPIPGTPVSTGTAGAAAIMAAALAGAAAALSGVVIGWAMGRSRVRRGR